MSVVLLFGHGVCASIAVMVVEVVDISPLTEASFVSAVSDLGHWKRRCGKDGVGDGRLRMEVSGCCCVAVCISNVFRTYLEPPVLF